jgi:hypothetical protein
MVAGMMYAQIIAAWLARRARIPFPLTDAAGDSPNVPAAISFRYPCSMPRDESVTDEYVAKLQAGFLAQAERVKAVGSWGNRAI